MTEDERKDLKDRHRRQSFERVMENIFRQAAKKYGLRPHLTEKVFDELPPICSDRNCQNCRSLLNGMLDRILEKRRSAKEFPDTDAVFKNRQ